MLIPHSIQNSRYHLLKSMFLNFHQFKSFFGDKLYKIKFCIPLKQEKVTLAYSDSAATLLKNLSNALGRRNAQFENRYSAKCKKTFFDRRIEYSTN